jgi:CRISPR system Cascade subunit CasA
MAYGSNNSVVDEVVDDAVLLHVGVLSDPPLRGAAVEAVADADRAVLALAGLAGNLAAAAGGETDPARTSARELGYFALDSPYRRWLAELKPGVDVVGQRTSWQEECRQLIGRLGADLVTEAGNPAWVGREHMGRHVDTGLAEVWFWSALRKSLPLAFPRSSPPSPMKQESET